MARDRTRPPSSLPSIRTICKDHLGPFWDVKFYPYVSRQDDPVILAICGYFDVHICRLIDADNEESNVDFINTYRLPEEFREINRTLNSCTWCYVDYEKPLLAITGESGQIQVISPFTGDLVYSLKGHGIGVVNDLATHPKYPWIVASCSIDNSIRIWDLRRAEAGSNQTCIIVCGHNLAHKAGVISISWHRTGRYIISGGFDHRICVWTLPDLAADSTLWHEISKEGRSRSRDEVRVIHYPHFISYAIHNNYVDTVMFWDDMILSKACDEDIILLWAIQGFNSARPPPLPSQAPKSLVHLETRNGFTRNPTIDIDQDVLEKGGLVEEPPYMRLMKFQNTDSKLFYMRFGMCQPSALFPDLHTILSVGSQQSKIRHWDLHRLLTGEDEMSFAQPLARSSPHKLSPFPLLRESAASSRSQSTFTPSIDDRETSTGATSFASDHPPNEEGELRVKYKLYDYETEQAPHKTNTVTNLNAFTVRGVGWSVCGRWCVAVGEAPGTRQNNPQQGVITVMRSERD